MLEREIPVCAPPDPAPLPPAFEVPPGSCDAHIHICSPQDRYPLFPERIYTPAPALLSHYRTLQQTLGLSRAVLVQPSIYGTDNRAMLDAMAAADFPCRGIAVVDPGISDRDLVSLHEAGIRGLRFNLVDVAAPSGELPLTAAAHFARRIKPLGWHIEFQLHADRHPRLDEIFAGFPVDIVFGHMGYMRSGKTVGNPGFQALLRLLRRGRCWVKLTAPYRLCRSDLPYADIDPIPVTLCETAPERLLWGSDWPHTNIKGPMPNDGRLLDLLARWVPDPSIRHRILVDNPAELYGF